MEGGGGRPSLTGLASRRRGHSPVDGGGLGTGGFIDPGGFYLASAASASSRRGPWAVPAPRGRFSPYPNLASWRWALGPFHARHAACRPPAGGLRAPGEPLSTRPIFSPYPNLASWWDRVFAIPKSDQLASLASWCTPATYLERPRQSARLQSAPGRSQSDNPTQRLGDPLSPQGVANWAGGQVKTG